MNEAYKLHEIKMGDEITYDDRGIIKRGTVEGWHLGDSSEYGGNRHRHLVIVNGCAIPLDCVLSRKRGAGTLMFA